MKKIIQYCCFVVLVLYSTVSNSQTVNSGLLSIATNTQWVVTGDYNNNNQELAIEIGSATENNLLTVSGHITVNGILKVSFANNFVPTTTQTFTIISANTVTGNFNSLSLPNGYAADIIYNASNVVLSNFRSSAIPIIGNLLACAIGTTSRLYIATSGGIWGSNNTGVATINSSGIVTPVANGNTTITYTYSSGGNTAISSTTFTVAAVPIPNAITGAANVCVGGSATLFNTTTGGVWSSLNNSAAINANSGVLTALSKGVASIKYTVTNGSGCSNYASYSPNIHALPNVPSISYASGTANPQTGAGGAFCANRTFTLAGNPAGGLWSKTGVITIGAASGIVNTGSSAGTATLTYTYTDANSCNSSKTISGSVAICASRGVNGVENEALKIENNFTIFPNPAKAFTYFKVEAVAGKGQITVSDVSGKIVHQQNITGQSTTINCKLNKGIYFVSVITTTGKATRKLVVE